MITRQQRVRWIFSLAPDRSWDAKGNMAYGIKSHGTECWRFSVWWGNCSEGVAMHDADKTLHLMLVLTRLVIQPIWLQRNYEWGTDEILMVLKIMKLDTDLESTEMLMDTLMIPWWWRCRRWYTRGCQTKTTFEDDDDFEDDENIISMMRKSLMRFTRVEAMEDTLERPHRNWVLALTTLILRSSKMMTTYIQMIRNWGWVWWRHWGMTRKILDDEEVRLRSQEA